MRRMACVAASACISKKLVMFVHVGTEVLGGSNLPSATVAPCGERLRALEGLETNTKELDRPYRRSGPLNG